MPTNNSSVPPDLSIAETKPVALHRLTSMFSSRLGTFTMSTIAAGTVAGVIVTAIVMGDDAPVDNATTAISSPVPVPVVEQIVEPGIVEPEPFDYGDCPPIARACVDLDGERAWLQQDGEVTYGAVPIGQGGPGFETPRASFHVSRKVIDDVSYVFNMAPMPYAVYFTNVGHAFHEGDPEGDSHGCIRLAPGDAEVYFNNLNVGDLIHIY